MRRVTERDESAAAAMVLFVAQVLPATNTQHTHRQMVSTPAPLSLPLPLLLPQLLPLPLPQLLPLPLPTSCPAWTVQVLPPLPPGAGLPPAGPGEVGHQGTDPGGRAGGRGGGLPPPTPEG